MRFRKEESAPEEAPPKANGQGAFIEGFRMVMRSDQRTPEQVVDDLLAEIEAPPDWEAIDESILEDATYKMLERHWPYDVAEALAPVVLARIQSLRISSGGAGARARGHE